MKIVDKVYIMSYDLVHGFSTQSGHHTPLYATSEQLVSTDRAVDLLLKKKVPSHKIVIGAAFYARMFQVEDTLNNGLYRPGKFYRGISFSKLYDSISSSRGFIQYRDPVAEAPYAFNPSRKILVTYDDKISVARKTTYALSKKLGGIMFWQLMDDKFRGGLLEAMYDAAH
jgi:chitinase